MSEQDREQNTEEKDQFSDENDVEAHKRRALTEEPAQDDDEGDDVEAHRRRA